MRMKTVYHKWQKRP